MQKRFVSWAAVSSLPQAKKISVDDQLQTNREHIEQWDGLLVEEIPIRGKTRSIITLEEACKYEEYARLLELIEARAFDVLIYLDRSRLGRKASLIDTIIEKCHEAGIVTYATESPPVSLEPKGFDFAHRVVGAIESIIAQHEVVKIQHRHEMGMAARVKAGNFPARIPYGWTANYTTENGAPVQVVRVDEEAKEIIQRVIAYYVDEGLSFRTIAARLRDEGIPPPRGRAWKAITIDRMLRLAWRYAGFVELNQRSKKRAYIRAKSRWPALIDEERAKQILAERTRRAVPRRSVESPHLFSQLVWCAKCERRMQARFQWREVWGHPGEREQTENYRCVTDGEPSHPRNQIAAFYLVDAVEKAILYVQDEANRQRILEGHGNERPRIEQSLNKARQQLREHEESVQRADDAYVLGKMDFERYSRQVDFLQRKRLKIEQDIAALQAQMDEQLHEEGLAERLLAIASTGLAMLHSNDVVAANVWFRAHLRIWIDNDNPEKRVTVEYL